MRRAAREASAFTLIELLGVMSIIIILAGLSVGVSRYVFQNAQESRTRTEIKAIEVALEAYKQDNGAYPPLNPAQFDPGGAGNPKIDTVFPTAAGNSNGWLNTIFVVRALCSNSAKIYMTFTPKQVFSTNIGGSYPSQILLDPGGKPYAYNPFAPQANPQTFDLWSAGVNGKSAYPILSSTNDDISNWQR